MRTEKGGMPFLWMERFEDKDDDDLGELGRSADDGFPMEGICLVKTRVEFRSTKFPPYEGEEETMNPGVWGKRLAEFLVGKLAEKGIEMDEPIAEDWGWYIPVRGERFQMALCCGHWGEADDEFLCFTVPSGPVVRKWFRKIDATPELERLTGALEEILAEDSEIGGMVWEEGI